MHLSFASGIVILASTVHALVVQPELRIRHDASTSPVIVVDNRRPECVSILFNIILRKFQNVYTLAWIKPYLGTLQISCVFGAQLQRGKAM
jgi:hypothetical protein